jgi:group I intron endonuclease
MKSGIYLIKNLINNKLYIGKACYLRQRLNNHKYLLRHNKHVNNYLQNAWNKYGEQNFEFSIIEYCDTTCLAQRECYWVDFYKANDSEFGYNLMIVGRKNYRHSEETKEKMKKAHTGRKMSPTQLINNTLSKYKSVLQFNKNGEFIQEWLGASYVRDVLGYNQANITAVCNGQRKSANGYIWKYKN